MAAISISECIQSLCIGNHNSFQGMTVFPIFGPPNELPPYKTLEESLCEKLLLISEISHTGSVPELKVVNGASVPVLLLAGEEVAGAKQNRILNTTILLKKKSETIVPVSCTEQGRWSYRSDHFYDSGIIAPRGLRQRKMSSVSHSLNTSRLFRSDQMEVWDQVNRYAQACGSNSLTGAMRDTYEARKPDITPYQSAFTPSENQNGMLVLIGNHVAGLDYISQPDAFARLHRKLIGSYAIETLTRQPPRAPKSPREQALHFIGRAFSLTEPEKRYKSLGHGWDYRFRGAKTVGSALAFRSRIIHMAIFDEHGEESTGRQ